MPQSVAVALFTLAISCCCINALYPKDDLVKIGQDSLPRVQTTRGVVQGSIIVTDSGNRGYGFQAVPYAEPPLGKLRFQTPVPKKPWKGILRTDHPGNACMQINFPQIVGNISEDCLHLNIFAPIQDLSRSVLKKYAVMVYIFGGGFVGGSPNQFKPEDLVDHFVSRDVIIIMPNFRLNAFGLWSTGTSDAPGNIEFQDPIFALKWIKEEIAAFGGDPTKVTIQGESSGGMAVSILTLSPLTEGLFHQAVPMSGSAVSDTLVATGSELDSYKVVASAVGCNKNSEWERGHFKKVVECMQKVSPRKLLLAFTLNMASSQPRVDGPGGVLPEHPLVLANKRRPVRTLLGTVGMETILFFGADDSIMASAFSDAACELGANGHPAVADACRFRYDTEQLKKTHPDEEHHFWYEMFINMTSDVMFYGPAFREADTLRKANSSAVYLYQFDYVKKGLEGFAPWHAMDLWYSFGFAVAPPGIKLDAMTEEDKRMSKIYTDLFANFVKYGDPTPYRDYYLPKWEPLMGPIGFNYYKIDLNPTMTPFYHYDSVEFWNSIVPYLNAFGQQPSLLLSAYKDTGVDPIRFSSIFDSYSSWIAFNDAVKSLRKAGFNPTTRGLEGPVKLSANSAKENGSRVTSLGIGFLVTTLVLTIVALGLVVGYRHKGRNNKISGLENEDPLPKDSLVTSNGNFSQPSYNTI